MFLHCGSCQVNIGLQLLLLVRYILHYLQCFPHCPLQRQCEILVFRYRIYDHLLFFSFAGSWLVITHKCTQQGSNFSMVKLIQNSLHNNLCHIYIHLFGNSALQCKSVYQCAIFLSGL